MAPHSFEEAWHGHRLPNYREGGKFAFDSLPPIPQDELDGSLSWLRETLLPDGCEAALDDCTEEKITNLRALAIKLNLTIPKTYFAFMSDPDLRLRIPSIGGSYWHVPETIEQHPSADGYLVCFRFEGQGGWFWYLYLTPNSPGHSVVATAEHFDADFEATDLSDLDDTFLCAATFESFLYRTWIEEWALARILTAQPLTSREEAYLNHYRPPGDTSDRRLTCHIHSECVLLPGTGVVLGADHPCVIDAIRPILSRNHQLRRAEVHIDEWKRNSPLKTFPGIAYCPRCRTDVLRVLSEEGAADLLQLLRTYLDASVDGGWFPR